MRRLKTFACIGGQDHRRLPAGQIQEVVEAAAMGLVLLVEVAVQGGDGASAPGKGDQQHEQAEIVKVVPKELPLERFEERLEFCGPTDDLITYRQSPGSLCYFYCNRFSIVAEQGMPMDSVWIPSKRQGGRWS